MSTSEPPPSPAAPDSAAVLAATREWLEKAVIGLKLCPFAKTAYVSGRVHMVVSMATTLDDLVDALATELISLGDADPGQRETTLLIHPFVLGDFLDYNEFLDLADQTVEAVHLTGDIQVASFHPDYQFAGTKADDISNFTNRSPYPMLHLLREASIAAAVASCPDVDDIPERNIATLRGLGHAGWAALFSKISAAP